MCTVNTFLFQRIVIYSDIFKTFFIINSYHYNSELKIQFLRKHVPKLLIRLIYFLSSQRYEKSSNFS